MKIEQIAFKRGYRVTEEGVLINPKGDEIGVIGSRGYHNSQLRVSGKSTHVSTHRLQAYQKYGEAMYNEGIEVRHLSGIRLDNSWANIAIGTHSQNMMDIPKQVRIKRAQYATSFVRKHDKETIKAFHKKHQSYKKTMAKFNISSKGTLHYILKH